MGVLVVSLLISGYFTWKNCEMRDDFYCRFFYTFLLLFLIKSLIF